MQTPSDRPDPVSASDQQASSQSQRTLRAAPAPTTPAVHHGWRIFAATMILIGGAFNVVDGIIAIFDTNYYLSIVQTSNGAQLVVTNNLHTWGWVAFIMGLVMVVTAGAIYLGTIAGRVIGVVLAGANMIFQLVFLPVYPLWALVMILVDVLVIYGLVARYDIEESMY